MKITLPPYSVTPLLQKTFIMLGVATFLVQTAGMLYGFIMGEISAPFDIEMLRMLPGMLLPALLFVLIFLLSGKAAPRRSRAFIAAIVTSTVLIIQQVVLMAVYTAAAPTMAQGDMPVSWLVRHADILSLVPVALATAGLVWFLKKRNLASTQATPRLQAVYIATVCVSYIVMLSMTIWENLQPTPYGSMDTLTLLSSILIPVLVPVVLFLVGFLTAKKKTPVWNKVFIGLIYVTIGVFVSTIFGAGLMLLSQVNPGLISMDIVNYSSMIAAAVAFIGIVIWHKKRHAY